MRVRGMVHSWFWPFIKFCGPRILFLLFILATQKIVCAELSEEHCLNCEQKRSAESTECLAFLQHQALLFTWLFMVLNTKGYQTTVCNYLGHSVLKLDAEKDVFGKATEEQQCLFKLIDCSGEPLLKNNFLMQFPLALPSCIKSAKVHFFFFFFNCNHLFDLCYKELVRQF